MVSIFLRSLVYNVLFYLVLAFWVIVGIPTFLMPRWGIVGIAQNWARSSIWLMRVICNTKVEYRGLEKIPKGPLIVASKHQSMWETFALLQFFDQPLYILKRELKWIPLFGWYLLKLDMIGVVRGAGGRSLLEMARRAGAESRSMRPCSVRQRGRCGTPISSRCSPGGSPSSASCRWCSGTAHTRASSFRTAKRRSRSGPPDRSSRLCVSAGR